MRSIPHDIFKDKYMRFTATSDRHPQGWCKCRTYPKYNHTWELARCPDCKMIFFLPVPDDKPIAKTGGNK